ncbi:hypothetical protein NQ317_010944 [Molorchus minor]|uniref:Uncharacterized protein n=1 Tax=Molorchus minor TaxID=1323400 RepID=A0ABQ9JMK8_9CUCU|nr:hypothetical protein NQ317_010944 [Molorchus minor]
MLENPSESAQSMTIQNIEHLDAKKGETMQNIGDRATNNAQQQITASKNGHISFSVASLLADTRPARSSSPSLPNSLLGPSSSPAHNSSDEEYDSNQEDSIVDVEDLNSEEKSEDGPNKDNEFGHQKEKERDFQKDSVLSQGPIRPTPFSALAAAVYQATHPNWPHQGLVNPFGGPGPMFQGATPFGVPNMNSGSSRVKVEMVENRSKAVGVGKEGSLEVYLPGFSYPISTTTPFRIGKKSIC